MPELIVIDRTGTRHQLSVKDGESVMQATRSAGLPVLGECNGSMACATCHIIVDPAWADRLTPPVSDEAELLDSLFDLTPTSRLGCQIVMTAALDGLTASLPAGS
ncbi:MAG: 2Fe-2S iron-sulfur cluster-binding protein [Acidocella sp.]|nr:2Fe-2S iron-sulfur cluster-binding protein [Acidocella sp.]